MQRLHAAVEAIAVVEVEGYRHRGGVSCALDHSGEVVEACVLDRAWCRLHYDRRAPLLGCTDDSHDELEVLHVEGAYGVVAFLRVQKHLLGGDEHFVLLHASFRDANGLHRWQRGRMPQKG